MAKENKFYLLVGSYGQDLGFVNGKGTGIVTLECTYDSAAPCKLLVKEVSRIKHNHGKPRQDGVYIPENSSYMCFHPSLDIVYFCDETVGRHGNLTSYSIDKMSGVLTPVGVTMPTKGQASCYVVCTENGNNLVNINYMESFSLINLDQKGNFLLETQHHTECKDFVADFCFPGKNITRQDTSHPHHAVLEGKFVFISDLGMDCIHQLMIMDDKLQFNKNSKHFFLREKGCGPRHMVLHPALPYLFVLCELTSMVKVLRVDKKTGCLSEINSNVDNCNHYYYSTLNTTPTEVSKETSDSCSTAAAIRMHPSGKYLYTSNRMVEKEGLISLFHIIIKEDSIDLKLMKTFPTSGEAPRDFILTKDGAQIILGNQNSNNIVFAPIDQTNGHITLDNKLVYDHDIASAVTLGIIY